MKLYNFTRLIKKYSVDFTLCRETEGRYVSGMWVAGAEEKIEMRGAIVPMNDRKLYGSGGTYTVNDRELYLTAPLPAPLSALKVLSKGNTYAVEEGRNFEDYADVAVYNLKCISQGSDKA